jgi:hypothetical protein
VYLLVHMESKKNQPHRRFGDNRRAPRKSASRSSKDEPTRPPPLTTPAVPWIDAKPMLGTVLQPLQEINERCLELLARAARGGRTGAFPFVLPLRDLLLQMTPKVRKRAAANGFLLVDLEFANALWWLSVTSRRGRCAPTPRGRGGFHRAAAVQLARATLMLAWHSLRADPRSACMLGISSEVGELIARCSLTELDRIAGRCFPHMRPRWEDRPGVWRQLLLSAQQPDLRRLRETNVRAVQLITGELIASLGSD